MKNSKFSETQIASILEEADAGMPVKVTVTVPQNPNHMECDTDYRDP